MVMIVLIPILTPIWPTLSGMIARLNSCPSVLFSRLAANGLLECSDMTGLEIETSLPVSFFLLFSASLVLLFGSTIYDTMAPSLVNKFSLAEFEQEVADRYLRTGGKDDLIQAIAVVRGFSDTDYELITGSKKTSLTEYCASKTLLVRELDDPADVESEAVSLMKASARAEYIKYDRSQPAWSYLSLYFTYLAIILILSLAVVQFGDVFNATFPSLTS